MKLSKESGLTLVEVVVVSVLLAFMSTILYSSLNGLTQSKERINSERIASRTARFVFSRLSREFRGSLAQPIYISDDSTSDNTENSTQSTNTAAKAQVYLIGIDAERHSQSNDSVQFISSSGAQAVVGGMANYGHVQIRYQLVDNPDDKESNNDEYPRRLLVREETPAGVTEPDIIKQRRVVFPIAHNISALNLRYFNNGKWIDQWMDDASGLPEAIEVSLSIANKDGKNETYKTAFAIQPKRGTNQSGVSGFSGFANPYSAGESN